MEQDVHAREQAVAVRVEQAGVEVERLVDELAARLARGRHRLFVVDRPEAVADDLVGDRVEPAVDQVGARRLRARGIGDRDEDRAAVVDRGAVAGRDQDGVAVALHDRGPVELVAGLEPLAVVDGRADEAAAVEVRIAIAGQRVRGGGRRRGHARQLAHRRRHRRGKPERRDLDAGVRIGGVLSVGLLVALVEDVDQPRHPGGVERDVVGQVQLDLVNLGAEAEQQAAPEGRVGGALALALELRLGGRAQVAVDLAHQRELVVRERGRHRPRAVERVDEVRGQHAQRAERRGVVQHVNALDAGLGRVADGVTRRRAAVREQREVARVMAALDRRAAQQVGHVRVHDPVDARRGLLDGLPEPLGQRLERAHRGFAVQRHRSAEEVLRIQVAEDQVRVGDGRQRAAAAVTGRAGARARRRRADLQHADRVDPGDRAAAGADALHGDLRDLERVLSDHRLVLELQTVADDQRDVERRAAHVRAEDVRLLVRAADELRPERAADRPGVEQADRALARGGDRHDAALGGHQQDGRLQARLAEPLLQAAQVARDRRPEVRVQRRRHAALVLAQHGRDVGRRGHEHVGERGAQSRGQAALVLGVEEAPQQADGDGVDARLAHLLDGEGDLVVGQLDDHTALVVDALAHAEDEPALDQRRVGHRQAVEVRDLALAEPGALLDDLADRERVLVADRRQVRGRRAVALDHRVRGHGRPVDEALGAGQHDGGVDAEPLGRRVHGAQDAPGQVLALRRRLRRDDAVALDVVDHAVRERAADVDCDVERAHSAVPWMLHSSMIGSPFCWTLTANSSAHDGQ